MDEKVLEDIRSIPGLVMVPDPRLRHPCIEVQIGKGIESLVAKMRQVMASCRQHGIPAVAIAAPQVGVMERVIVFETEQFDAVLINPIIVKKSGSQKRIESCLSFPPYVHYSVERADIVKFRYIDPQGLSHTMKFHDVFATIVQHELDHLDGIMMDDNGDRVLVDG
jgi:peptide deformylase